MTIQDTYTYEGIAFLVCYADITTVDEIHKYIQSDFSSVFKLINLFALIFIAIVKNILTEKI